MTPPPDEKPTPAPPVPGPAPRPAAADDQDTPVNPVNPDAVRAAMAGEGNAEPAPFDELPTLAAHPVHAASVPPAGEEPTISTGHAPMGGAATRETETGMTRPTHATGQSSATGLTGEATGPSISATFDTGAVVSRSMTGGVPRAATRSFQLLPGEREEIPSPQPYSLRPAKPDDAVEGSADSASVTRRRTGGPHKALWALGGAAAGGLLFAGAYFTPLFGASLPFPALRVTADVPPAGPPEPVEGPWILSGGYFLAAGPSGVHAVNASGELPVWAGRAPMPEGSGKPSMPGLISEPGIDGPAVAWLAKDELRWASVEAPSTGGAAAPGGVSLSGEIPMRRGDRLLYPPKIIPNWTAPRPERFLAAGRNEERDFVLAVDPRTGEKRTWDAPARIAAPPDAFYDPAAKTGAAAVATVKGILILRDEPGGLKSASEGFALEFEEPWDESAAASMIRVRLDGDRRGWALALADEIVVVEFIPPAGVKRVFSKKFKKSGDGAETKTAPEALAFPDGNRPSADRIAAVLSPRKAVALSRDASGGYSAIEIDSPGSNVYACDLNGDGYWDLTGFDSKGRPRAVNGLDGKLVPKAFEGEGPPPAGPVLWMARNGFVEAAYLTAKQEPARLRVALPWKPAPELAERVERDRRWRAEGLPL